MGRSIWTSKHWADEARAARLVCIGAGVLYLFLGLCIWLFFDEDGAISPKEILLILHLYVGVTCLLFSLVFTLISEVKDDILPVPRENETAGKAEPEAKETGGRTNGEDG